MTNPNYWTSKPYQINCQRCVYAWEMQRRGYDVEALPNNGDPGDVLPIMAETGGWPDVMDGGRSQLVSFPSRNTAKLMAAQMADWGEGARAVVRVRWTGNRGGHVFVAEQTKSGVKYFDPQTGMSVNIDSYLKDAVKKHTKLMRIDNLEPTDLILKCVKKRGT